MFNPQDVLDSVKFDFLYLDITASCNLRCKHCLFGINPTHLTQPQLSREEQKIIIDNALSYGIKRILFSGKELFVFPQQSLELLTYCSKCKDEIGGGSDPSSFQYGCITNGTLLRKDHIQQIPSNIGWIDVSMEGTEEYHERVRGEGTYKRSLAAIDALVGAGLPVCISTTATSLNVDGIIPGIQELICHGVQKFFIGHYVPVRLQDPLRLSNDRLIQLIRDLIECSKSHPEARILTELEGPHAVACVEQGVFALSDIVAKAEKPHEFFVALTDHFFVKWQRVFNSFLYDVRVSPDGWVITCEEEHPIHHPGFMNKEQSINIRDCDFDFKKLEQKIRTERKIFYQYLNGIERHECRQMPCFELCYGWNQYAHFVLAKKWSRQSMNCEKQLYEHISGCKTNGCSSVILGVL